MKRILISLVLFTAGAGAAYLYVKNNGGMCANMSHAHGRKGQANGFERGSLEALKVRGIKSLTRLELHVSEQASAHSKQAAKLRLLCDDVTALKGKFADLITEKSVDAALANIHSHRNMNQAETRYAEGSLESIQARGVRTLTTLELMIARRIDASSDQSEAVLKALNKDVIALKEKFNGLVLCK